VSHHTPLSLGGRLRHDKSMGIENSTPEPRNNAAMLNEAVIRTDQLHALSGLLSLEDVVAEFAGLSTCAQAAIFGLFEYGLADVRTNLTSGL